MNKPVAFQEPVFLFIIHLMTKAVGPSWYIICTIITCKWKEWELMGLHKKKKRGLWFLNPLKNEAVLIYKTFLVFRSWLLFLLSVSISVIASPFVGVFSSSPVIFSPRWALQIFFLPFNGCYILVSIEVTLSFNKTLNQTGIIYWV